MGHHASGAYFSDRVRIGVFAHFRDSSHVAIERLFYGVSHRHDPPARQLVQRFEDDAGEPEDVRA